VIDRQTIHIHDFTTSMDEFPEAVGREHGFRTTLTVPLLREGTSIGVIIIRRVEVRPFSDTQITLLQTFADQAVIAIENVRLFKELEARNHDLTRALDQQTATSDILRAISASPIDVQPVFEAIARNSVRLCNGVLGAVFRFDGEFMHVGLSTVTWRMARRPPDGPFPRARSAGCSRGARCSRAPSSTSQMSWQIPNSTTGRWLRRLTGAAYWWFRCCGEARSWGRSACRELELLHGISLVEQFLLRHFAVSV
jgi:GAF domain